MSAFDYAESEHTVALAQIAATMTGSVSERFSRIAALMDAALATSSKVMDGHTVIKIVRVASAINRPEASPEVLVREAVGLLQTAGGFRSERQAREGARTRIRGNALVRYRLPFANEGTFMVSGEIVKYVEDCDFSSVTTFDKWLKMMMPTRKKIDRLPRFRLYLGGKNGDLDDMDAMLQEVKLRFKGRLPRALFGWDGKAATADFMEWDIRQTKKSLSERGGKGAAMRHQKSD